jgi:hypothetical protein
MATKAPNWPSGGGARPTFHDPGHTADLPLIPRRGTVATPPRDEERGPASDTGSSRRASTAAVAVRGAAASPGWQAEASGLDLEKCSVLPGRPSGQGVGHSARRDAGIAQAGPVAAAPERLRVVRRAVAPRQLTLAEGEVAFCERMLRVPVFGDHPLFGDHPVSEGPTVAHQQPVIVDELTGSQGQPAPLEQDVNGSGGRPASVGPAGAAQAIHPRVERITGRRLRWPRLLRAAGAAWAQAGTRVLGALRSWARGDGEGRQVDAAPAVASRGPWVAGARRRPRRPRRLSTTTATGGWAAGARHGGFRRG